MAIFLTPIIGLLILYITYQMVTDSMNYWKKRGFPQLKGHFLVGNFGSVVFFLKTLSQNSISIYNELKRMKVKYGGFYFFRSPSLMILDLELINSILIKNFSFFSDRPFFRNDKVSPLNSSIFSEKGSSWKTLRTSFSPCFNTSKTRDTFEEITRCADEIITEVLEINTSGAFDVRRTLGMFSLNSTACIILGARLDCHKDAEKQWSALNCASHFFDPSRITVLTLLLAGNFTSIAERLNVKLIPRNVVEFFTRLPKYAIDHRKESETNREDLLQMMVNYVEKKKSTIQANELTEGLPFGQNKEDPAIDIFLAANTFQFLSAGPEGVTNVLSFAMFEIAKNPIIQKRLQEEVDKTVNENGFNYTSIKNLPYLTQILNETMRQNPTLESVDRICTKNFPIPGTDQVIRKGEMVTISIVGLHNDPEHWKDPEIFDPDRFEDMTNIKRGTFLPFGLGPRNCIAVRLAMLQMQVFLARTIMKYNLKLSSRTRLPLKRLTNSLINHVEGGIWLELEHR